MMMLRGRRIVFAVVVTVLYCGSAVMLRAQTLVEIRAGETESSSHSDHQPIDAARSSSGTGIVAVATPPKKETGVDWFHLARGSFAFLAVENAFRCATEQGTRDGFTPRSFPDILISVGSLHGWADGDPFLVNYVGHPMQGAVSGFIWQHNDRAYRTVEFGKNSRYWKSKLRSAAFAYVYSVQFEIGPMSEASLGHIQALYPQQGFVDQVVTPTIGWDGPSPKTRSTAMSSATIEAHTANPYIRLFARGVLNPSRSMANVMTGELPWHRDDRPGRVQTVSRGRRGEKLYGASDGEGSE